MSYRSGIAGVLNWPLLSKIKAGVARAVLGADRLALRRQATRIARRDEARVAVLEQYVPKGGVGAEIGVHKGDFTQRLLKRLQPKRLHLLDPWYLIGREWDWGPPDRSTINALCGILKRFSDELASGQVVLHIGWDLEVLASFPDDSFDWVYLDTTHLFVHTRKELLLLARKVKSEGFITGDDWYSDPSYQHHGVYRAVLEFLEREPYELLHGGAKDHQWLIRSKQTLPL